MPVAMRAPIRARVEPQPQQSVCSLCKSPYVMGVGHIFRKIDGREIPHGFHEACLKNRDSLDCPDCLPDLKIPLTSDRIKVIDNRPFLVKAAIKWLSFMHTTYRISRLAIPLIGGFLLKNTLLSLLPSQVAVGLISGPAAVLAGGCAYALANEIESFLGKTNQSSLLAKLAGCASSFLFMSNISLSCEGAVASILSSGLASGTINALRKEFVPEDHEISTASLWSAMGAGAQASINGFSDGGVVSSLAAHTFGALTTGITSFISGKLLRNV